MTPGPGSCIAPKPIRWTVKAPREYVSMPSTLPPAKSYAPRPVGGGQGIGETVGGAHPIGSVS